MSNVRVSATQFPSIFESYEKVFNIAGATPVLLAQANSSRYSITFSNPATGTSFAIGTDPDSLALGGFYLDIGASATFKLPDFPGYVNKAFWGVVRIGPASNVTVIECVQLPTW